MCALLVACDFDSGRSSALDSESACRSIAIHTFPGFHLLTFNMLTVVFPAVLLIRPRVVLLLLCPTYATWVAFCFSFGVIADVQSLRYLGGHISFLAICLLILFKVENLSHIKLQADALSRRTRRLERERVAREASIQAHKATLGYVMHELRNPLHIMAGSLWVMRDGWPFAADHELSDELATLERAVSSCKVLVDDVLDLRRLREGRLTLQPRACRLAGVVRDAVNQVSRISPVPVLLRMRDADDDGVLGLVRAVFDSMRVKQVLLNGLTNAVKASRQHAVVVEVRTVGMYRANEESAASALEVVGQLPVPHDSGMEGSGAISFDSSASSQRSGGMELTLVVPEGHQSRVAKDASLSEKGCLQWASPPQRPDPPTSEHRGPSAATCTSRASDDAVAIGPASTLPLATAPVVDDAKDGVHVDRPHSIRCPAWLLPLLAQQPASVQARDGARAEAQRTCSSALDSASSTTSAQGNANRSSLVAVFEVK
eukprot:CAMPEP_0196793514 /NCGR_PEP_ID=MMETSP1104-20130614/33091_1 /TAXON_ID=33652 /ORGANISM="Cafeteria sp., Strain Caron Lab Isolate" /LENGTH=486 /DNA_ID=CAMNT_0042163885 /DNA_START=90 /DNA_END=1547 /DNA_ORIENTATION=+